MGSWRLLGLYLPLVPGHMALHAEVMYIVEPAE